MDSLDRRLDEMGLGGKVVKAMLLGLAQNLSKEDIAELLEDLLGEKAQEVAESILMHRRAGLVAVPAPRDLRTRGRPGQELELPLLEYMMLCGSAATVFLYELGTRARDLLAYTYPVLERLPNFTSGEEFVPSRRSQSDDTQLRIIFERLGWASAVTRGFRDPTDEWVGNRSPRPDGRTPSGHYLTPAAQARIVEENLHILRVLSDEEMAALALRFPFVHKRNPDDQPGKSPRRGTGTTGTAEDGPIKDALLHFLLELAQQPPRGGRWKAPR